MPLYVPKNLPAVKELRTEGIIIYDNIPKGVQPLRILLLNLMPIKTVTEHDIALQLAKSALHVQLIPMKIRGQKYKNTPQEHMDAFYRDFDDLQARCYDGIIVTGAPVEQMPFEDVRYWKQLTEIFDWSRTEVHSALYLCWGAQAALYYFYSVPKYTLPQKLFGVYEQRVLRADIPLFRGFDSIFEMPGSRYSEVRSEDIAKVSSLEILVESNCSGVGVVKPNDRNELFVMGHLEYPSLTLDNEYHRDVKRGLAPSRPEHYYIDDEPTHGINYSWKKSARLFYNNWLDFYVNRQL